MQSNNYVFNFKEYYFNEVCLDIILIFYQEIKINKKNIGASRDVWINYAYISAQ